MTLTGVGGVGKTRLALRVADDLQRGFRDGVWFVDLGELGHGGAPARDMTAHDAPCADKHELHALAFVLMSALDIRPRGAEPPIRELAGHLDGRQALLVLDNCEHVLPECAQLVDELLRACPRLRVVATSRAPLAVAAEQCYPVPPLRVPAAGASSLADVARCESVALFVARVRSAVPDFELTAQNQDSVADLCHRLDGVPLAIELAAARVRALAPQQIVPLLDERFRLLSLGSREAPARQQTLKACVTWSFDLCSEPERLLWCRLSTFVGGFELDAVEEVCTDDALPVDGLAAALAGLADKSIVDRVDLGDRGDHDRVRYRMLETLRDYGRDRLGEADDHALVLQRRHRDWCRRLVEQAAAQWVSDRQGHWFDRLSRERANLRAAVESCLADPAEAENALHMLVTLPRSLWSNHGSAREGLSWLDRALTQVTAPNAVGARGTALAAGLATLAGETAIADRRLVEAGHLAEHTADPVARALCAYVAAGMAWRRNDLAAALDAAERGLSVLPPATESDLLLRVHLLLHAQWAAGMAGDRQRATQYSRRLLEITVSRGETANRSMAEWGLAVTAWRAGETHEAAGHVRQSIRLRHLAAMPYLQHAALNVELMAWIAAREQRPGRAATLLGAADSLLTQHGTPISTAYHMLLADHRSCERRAREALGDTAFAVAFDAGRALPFDDALAFAVEAAPTSPPRPTTPAVDERTPLTPLTRREHHVAVLVGNGMSNKEIARALVVSRRTAEAHVQRILVKLGFSNRAQIAAWIADRHHAPSGSGP